MITPASTAAAEPKTITVASYNTMHGLNARSISEGLIAHAAINAGWYQPKNRLNHQRIQQIINALQDINADIVAFLEVLGSQQQQNMRQALNISGYPHVFSASIAQKYINQTEYIMIGSKYRGELQLFPDNLPQPTPHMGANVGFLPKNTGLRMIFSHFPVVPNHFQAAVIKALAPNKLLFTNIIAQQCDAFSACLGQLEAATQVNRPTIIMGDFNAEKVYVPGLQTYTPKGPTFQFPVAAGLMRRQFDYVLTNADIASPPGATWLASDHAMIHCQFCLPGSVPTA